MTVTTWVDKQILYSDTRTSTQHNQVGPHLLALQQKNWPGDTVWLDNSPPIFDDIANVRDIGETIAAMILVFVCHTIEAFWQDLVDKEAGDIEICPGPDYEQEDFN